MTQPKYICKHMLDDGRLADWKHPAYGNYTAMIHRCYNPKNIKYPAYGAKGIQVCERWLGACGFHNFANDMGIKSEGYSIDRIDPERGYTPENCRWATYHQQNHHRSTSNRMPGVIYRGDGKRLKRWRAMAKMGDRTLTGSFHTEQEAIAAVIEYRKELGIVV